MQAQFGELRKQRKAHRMTQTSPLSLLSRENVSTPISMVHGYIQIYFSPYMLYIPTFIASSFPLRNTSKTVSHIIGFTLTL